MRNFYQGPQCFQDIVISLAEAGIKKEFVATQTTKAKPGQIVVLANCSPK